MAKYVFVTGGVVSGLGKGITAASLGRLLKMRGLRVASQKLDPYMNVDPGTMSPFQHGEVFVTDDGAETDLDLGHYERFIDENLTRYSNLTSGKVYWNVLNRERKGEYLGQTVQVIPHITDEIKDFIFKGAESSGADRHIPAARSLMSFPGFPADMQIFIQGRKLKRTPLGMHGIDHFHASQRWESSFFDDLPLTRHSKGVIVMNDNEFSISGPMNISFNAKKFTLSSHSKCRHSIFKPKCTQSSVRNQL